MAANDEPNADPAGPAGPRQYDEHELVARPRWRWWSSILPGDQNLIADVERIRNDINRLATSDLTLAQRDILMRCARNFVQAANWHNSVVIKRRVMVIPKMFGITEDLLLVCPTEELEARWFNIVLRLKDEPKEIAELAKSIKAHFQDKQSPLDLEVLRRRMRTAKEASDERVILEVLNASSLLLQCSVFLAFAIVSTACLVGTLVIDNRCPGLFGCSLGNNTAYSIFGMLAAGVLGGSLSGLSHIQQRTEDSLPVVKFSAMQPIIGGAIALVLYFGINLINTTQVGYPSMYVSAVAVGFSERVFGRSFRERANQIGQQLSQAAGLSHRSTRGERG